MSKTDRLIYYFKAIGPGKLATHNELYDLLWPDPENCPDDLRNNLKQWLSRARRKGLKVKADSNCANPGWRLE